MIKSYYKYLEGMIMEATENYNLKLKKEVTITSLKTVSAYSNYNDGKIIFEIVVIMEIW